MNPYLRRPTKGPHVGTQNQVVLTDRVEDPNPPHVLTFENARERARFMNQLYSRKSDGTVFFDPQGRVFLRCRNCRRKFEVGAPKADEPFHIMFRLAAEDDRQRGDRYVQGALRCLPEPASRRLVLTPEEARSS